MALTIKIRADASHFKKTIAGIEVQASGLTGVMGKLATSQVAFGAALSAAAAGAIALGAGLAFIKDASSKAAGMESLQVQFEVLTKSASKATELIKSFRDEAIKSPLSVTDYAQAAQKMLTVGTSFDKVLPTLKMVGDVSMGSSLKFERLALAYSQVISKGRLLGTENNQLAESGFSPLAEISKRTGESMAQLMKRMETTGITSGEVTQAFKDATSAGGLFFGALDRGASTTEGKIAKFNDAIAGLKVSFGMGFNEGLKSALDATNAFLPQIETKFATAGELVGGAIKNSIAGNHEMLLGVGTVIGETIMAGTRAAIKISASSLIRDGIGGYIGLGGHVTGDTKTKIAGSIISGGINSAMGPRTSMADTIKGETGGISQAVDALEKIAAEQKAADWKAQLERQSKATEELVRQGQKVTKENLQQIMFSR